MHLGVNFQNGYWTIDMERFLIGAFRRQTGRSYRMVEEAIKIAETGQRVYIIMSQNKQYKYFQRLINNAHANLKVKVPISSLDIRLEGPTTLGDFCLNTMTVKTDLDAKLLVDHKYFEVFYGFAIKGFHKYDA